MSCPTLQTVPPPLPCRPPAAFRWWHGLLLLFLCGLAAAGLLVWSVLTPWREVRALRETLGATVAGGAPARVQVSVGAIPLVVARVVAGLLPAPPEAGLALDALRGVSVGVYEVSRGGAGGGALLEAADRGMTAQGWERVVGVVDGGEVVGVYVPRDLAATDRMRVALFVRSNEELVVVSARGNLEPLVELARGKFEGAGVPFLAGAFAGH